MTRFALLAVLALPVISSEAPTARTQEISRAHSLSETQPPSDAAVAARVDSFMTRLEALGFNGAVLITRGGVPVVKRAWGWADRDKQIRADVRTTWSLGSVTKQFTAAAILRLEQQGRLHTTDSIRRSFPDAPPRKRDITIHQLLTHTAGFESDYAPTDYTPNTREEYVSRMFADPLRSPPGAEHFYSNAGYSLLAAIIEKITGKDFEAALTELVLAPAGMRETGYLLPHWDARRIAHGYDGGRDWGTIVDRLKAPGAPYWALRGNGGLQTTLTDMMQWDAMLRTSTIFADSTRTKFMTGYVDEGQGDSKYAYGWAVHKSRRGTNVVEHNGGNGIYVAEFKRFVDERITIFVASSVSDLPATPVIDAIESIVFGDVPVQMPPHVVAVTAAELTTYAGAWSTASGERVDIAAAAGKLRLSVGGPTLWLLLAAGDTAASERGATLGAKALTIVQSMAKGDAQPLFDALGGREPLVDLTQQVRGLAVDRTERLGQLKEITLLGSVPRPGGVFVSTVRLDYERAAVSNVIVWNGDGTVRDRVARPLAPAVFVRTGTNVFERFEMGGGRVPLAVRLEREPAAPAQLVVSSPTGQRLVLRRASRT